MQSIIIEIRAGAGGEEAALFASDLFNMYTRYATNKGWRFSILDSNKTELGGIKQITFELKGETAHDEMRYEGGVHRVQRVPKTEKSNRLHTSTISVAVLENVKEASITINPSDLKYDYFCSSGKGGQNVNKRQTAIRITHVPTGEVATSQTQRNLEQNKQTAIAMLKSRLLTKKQNKQTENTKEDRQAQIGTADRSEKIRTYNFPQDRITDHRIQKSFHNLEKIMDGRMEKMVKTLQEKLS